MEEKNCQSDCRACRFSVEIVRNFIEHYYLGQVDEMDDLLYDVEARHFDDYKRNEDLYKQMSALLDKDGKVLFEDFLESQLIMQGYHYVEQITKGFLWGVKLKFMMDTLGSETS